MRTPVRTGAFAAWLSALVLVGAASCGSNADPQTEDASTPTDIRGTGMACHLDVDAGATQAVYNSQALECPSRICIKPAGSGNKDTDSVAFCTIECSADSDCDGEPRDINDSQNNDKRCQTGFVCGVAFEVGPLCCKKICLCKDFLPAGTLPTPKTCTVAGGCD
jgi:hypothetical protein